MTANHTILSIITMILLATSSSVIRADDDIGEPLTDDCIMLIGDSVAQGDAVFEVPGQGFPVIETPPISDYLVDTLDERSRSDVAVVDFSAGATSLLGETPYPDTPQYEDALTQPCRFIVVFPWINDLRGMTDPDFPQTYLAILAELVDSFRADERTLFVLNFYPLAPTPLGDLIYEGSITSENVADLNAALDDACTLDEIFAGVVCVDVSALGADDTDSDVHLLTAVDRATYDAVGYRPARVTDADLLQTFWRDNPDGVILGDGVHLSERGKQLVVDVLLDALGTIDSRFTSQPDAEPTP